MTKEPRAASEPTDRILDAAATLFRHKGFDACSVRDIAAAAAILPGSLHYRYPSKEGVLVALIERAIDRLVAGVLAAIAGEQDPVERARLAIRAHLRLLLCGDDSIYVLLYDRRSLSPEAARALVRELASYEQFCDEILAQAATVAPLRPGVDLVLLRRFGFGAVNWVAQWYDPNGPYTPEELADHLWRLMAFGALFAPYPPADATGTRDAGGAARTRRGRSDAAPTARSGGPRGHQAGTRKSRP